MGGWTIGGALGEGGAASGWSGVEEQESIRAVHAALDAGVNFFDTADAYGAGRGEEVLGRALRDRRSMAIVATKVGNVWNGSGFDWNARKEHILAAVHQSLRRLGTEYIDLYQLHGGREDDDLGAAIEAFEQLKWQGHIRHYGVSSHRRQVIERMALGHIASVQLNYNILERDVEEWHLPFCHERSIGVIIRGPLARGLLTGKFTPDSRFPPDDVRHRAFPGGVGPQLERVNRLRSLQIPGRTLGQAAIQFVLAHPAVSAAIPGARSAGQVQDNSGAVYAPLLSREELMAIDNVSPPRGPGPAHA